MSDGRLRVFVITRKHLGAIIVLGAVIVGMWSVLSRETSLPASAPVAGVRWSSRSTGPYGKCRRPRG